MSKRKLSTFESEMKEQVFREKFQKAYREFLLSELIIALMESNDKSVRRLAQEVGISPSIIQNLRSGIQEDLKLSNFLNISNACGYNVILDNGKHRIYL